MKKEKIKELHYTKSLCDNWDWFTECEGCNIGISLHCLCYKHLKCNMCDEICSKDFEWNKEINEIKKVTRFELINKYERQIVIYSKEHKNVNKNINKIEYDLQDNEQTLKVFIG